MTKSLYGLPTEDLPEVLEDLQLRFAGNILQTNQLDNLQWAKDFMDAYERKHKLGKG